MRKIGAAALMLFALGSTPAGAEEGVLLCAGCHGMSGEGRAAAGYPRLAGQPQAYLQRQLEAYADGRRADAVMAPLAKRLGSQERVRLAAHYAALVAPVEKTAGPVPPPSERGRILATVGDNTLRVQACENCHGPGGTGQPPFTPYLAGLHREYLHAELLDWRNDTRRTDPSGHMNLIAKQLSEQDIAALAAHYSREAPPAQPRKISRKPEP
jgi:cytochrome c553